MIRKMRFSAAALFRTAQTFMVVFSAVAALYAALSRPALYERYDVLFGLLAAYVVCTAASRRLEHPVLLSLVGAAALAAGWFLAGDVLDKVFFMIAAAAGFGASLRERQLTTIVGRHSLTFLLSIWSAAIPFALMAACSYFKLTDCARWLFMWTALYIPVSVGAWLNDRFELSIQSFENRTAQPAETIRGNMRGYVALTIAGALVVALLMPFEDGRSVFSTLVTAIGGLLALCFTLIGKLAMLLTPEIKDYGVEDVMPQGEESLGAAGGTASLIENIVIVLVLAALGAFLVYRLVRLIVWLVKKYIDAVRRRREFVPELQAETGDTVEKLSPAAKKSRRSIFDRLSADEQIRRCYQKKVRQTAARCELTLEPGATPDEIAALAAEKGCDITGLTAIYKKARYRGGCSDEELREARRLLREDTALSSQ